MSKEETKKVKVIADKVGQRIAVVYDKASKKQKTRPVRVKVDEVFELDCPIKNGKPVVPRWTHELVGEELKAVEARALAAHKKAGDARAINPVK